MVVVMGATRACYPESSLALAKKKKSGGKTCIFFRAGF
jgi:hypothetical protein